MPQIIAIANQKGGVGKTTTTANLGSALAKQGKRVLLIDLDPQAALTYSFGLDPYTLQASAYSIMMKRNPSIVRIMQPLNSSHSLLLVPANNDLSTAEVQMVNMRDSVFRLREALERNHYQVDYVLIDTPPNLNMLTINGLVAAHYVYVPLAPNFLAMRTVRALMENVWRIKARLNEGLKLLGMLPTLYIPGRRSDEHIQTLVDVFGSKVYKTPIEYDEVFEEAAINQKTVVDMFPDHPGARTYTTIAQEIVNHG